MTTAMQVLARYGEQTSRNWVVLSVLGSILIALVVILGIFVLWYRKRYVDKQSPDRTEPLTLGDLRDLRAKGLIDEEEFKRLWDTIIHEARSSAGLDQAEPEATPRSDKPPSQIGAGRAEAEEPPAAEPAREAEPPPGEPEQGGPDR